MSPTLWIYYWILITLCLGVSSQYLDGIIWCSYLVVLCATQTPQQLPDAFISFLSLPLTWLWCFYINTPLLVASQIQLLFSKNIPLTTLACFCGHQLRTWKSTLSNLMKVLIHFFTSQMSYFDVYLSCLNRYQRKMSTWIKYLNYNCSMNFIHSLYSCLVASKILLQ